MAQRVAGLLEDGTDPEGIVAFTFTNRAAAELKQRINMNVWTRLKLAQKRRR